MRPTHILAIFSSSCLCRAFQGTGRTDVNSAQRGTRCTHAPKISVLPIAGLAEHLEHFESNSSNRSSMTFNGSIITTPKDNKEPESHSSIQKSSLPHSWVGLQVL